MTAKETDASAAVPSDRGSRVVRILLVEDDPEDALLLENGEQALEHLRDAPATDRPELVLLDLNMALMGGHEVPVQIRADHRLSRLPVIVLSTSGTQADIEGAYRHLANTYVRRPARLSGLMEALQAIDGFWFHMAELPRPQP